MVEQCLDPKILALVLVPTLYLSYVIAWLTTWGASKEESLLSQGTRSHQDREVRRGVQLGLREARTRT